MKRQRDEITVTKKLPHATAAVEAVSRMICACAKIHTNNANEIATLASAAKTLAEAERVALVSEVISYDSGPLSEGIFLKEHKESGGSR